MDEKNRFMGGDTVNERKYDDGGKRKEITGGKKREILAVSKTRNITSENSETKL